MTERLGKAEDGEKRRERLGKAEDGEKMREKNTMKNICTQKCEETMLTACGGNMENWDRYLAVSGS
jgi:hypothetical protein